jgi:hypothetical protein
VKHREPMRMQETNAQSIADRSPAFSGRRLFAGVFVGTALIGSLAAWHYAQAGLTLSHYDARAHLVVARRVIDSLTPGWRQFGAVWLPLPHLLNFLPVQFDWAYRTGAIAVAISVFFLAGGLAAVAVRLFSRTGSMIAALAPAALMLANPNLLYLQSTPMTEPMLIGLALAAVASADAWAASSRDADLRRTGWLLAALVLTRYEGWLIAAAIVAVVAAHQRPRSLRLLVTVAAPPAGAVAAFLVLSYASTGQWFLSRDFYVPDPSTLNQPLTSLARVAGGLRQLSNDLLLGAAAMGAALCLLRSRRSLSALLPLALLAGVILPLGAFTAGHPFRIRYMVPLVAGSAVLAGVALGAASRRARALAAAALLIFSFRASPPFDGSAPMLREAQWEAPYRLQRQRVTDVLRESYDGTPILASMGALAHYMQDASGIGLGLRNFLHEGNGDLWKEALRDPRRSVRWILIEEAAEGGGLLATRARNSPAFLEGFRRVVEGGGMVLYERTN